MPELLKLLQRLLRTQLRYARRRKSSGPILIAILTIGVFGISQLLEQPDAPLPPQGSELACKIGRVYDGDTVSASCDDGKLKIRVFGIDAPEMGQKPWGNQSRELLRSMLPSSETRLKVMDTDYYGRVVAKLFKGDQDLGLELVRQGGAVVYAKFNDSKTYQAAQAEAKREKLGIWSRPGSQQKPWEWRKLNPQ